MKTLLITFALLTGSRINAIAALSPAAFGDSATSTLTVAFTHVDQRAGMIYVGLVNEGSDMNGDTYRKTRIAVPATGDIRVSFEGLPAGKYAVKVYQDLNANQRLDRSGQVPSEPFGFSNLTTLLAPPSFSQCAFDLNGPRTITITLIGQ